MQKFLFVLLAISILACSPQVTEPIIAPEPEPTESVQDIVENPCTTFDELDPSIRGEVEDNYVIYRDYMRSKKYDTAMEIWKKAYYACHAADGKIRYQFDDGVILYKNLYRNTTDQALRDSYVDSIYSIYDKRIECFPADAATVNGKKAFNSYYELRGYLSDEEIFDLFKRSFDGNGDEPDYFIINPFTRTLYDQVLKKNITTEEASNYAQKILSVIDRNLADCKGKECDTWEIINEYSPDLLSNLEGIKGFYPCEYFADKYFPQYETEPDNCDVIESVYRKLIFAGCEDSDPQLIAIKAAYQAKCYVAPPSQGPLKLAYTALNEGRFEEAIRLYDEYLATSSDQNKKAEINLRVAKVYYVHIKNFPKARKYAHEAAKARPNWGAPYMLIGKLYASSGPLCGPGRGWDSQVVTWPAIDKFKYAKKIDPSVSVEANKLINQYEKYMPSVEDLFSRRLSKGDAFRVPCWIQENTTVRPATNS